jgi:hypothetical protein
MNTRHLAVAQASIATSLYMGRTVHDRFPQAVRGRLSDNVPALPTRRSESGAEAAHASEREPAARRLIRAEACAAIHFFGRRSRTSVAAKRSRSERAAAHAFVSRRPFAAPV